MALAAGLALSCAASAAGQDAAALDAPVPQLQASAAVLSDRLVPQPSLTPSASIEVEPLGFASPNVLALGLNQSFVSLDFLDEQHLLFTFQAPGLVRRSTQAGESERTIRALVLSLPSEQTEAEAVWTVHDRARYLWRLPGGRFLLRDGSDLKLGGQSLELKPSLHFPGPVEFLEVEPGGGLLLTNSRESRPASSKTSSEPRNVLRILRLSDGAPLLVSRSETALRLPLNGEGVVESLPMGQGFWRLTLSRFAGEPLKLGGLESACAPESEFVSSGLLLTLGCAFEGGRSLTATTTSGRTLWSLRTQGMALGDRFVLSESGLRMARLALALEKPFDGHGPVEASQIKGQLVQVMDLLDGRVVLETVASPALDAGGNVALSPSGRRVAVLAGGKILIFDLPAPQLFPVLGTEGTTP